MAERKRIKKPNRMLPRILVIVAILIVVAAVVVRVLRSRVTAQYGSTSSAEVQTAEVTTGSISTTVSGSGILQEDGAQTLEIPSILEVDDVQVESGDTVESGDIVATVDDSSLASAMSQVQTALDEKDAELEETGDETVDDEITSSVSGRVKKIYAKEGEEVSSVMYDHGALLLLSLDGYMAVDIETDALSAGDEVSVAVDGGSTYDGTVDSVKNGTATILLTDKGPAYGKKATVSQSGTELGTAKLYIHEPLKITGYAGTIDDIKVSVNDKVSADTTLFTLTDTSYSAGYEALLKEREELEDIMEQLVEIYRDGGVRAEVAGAVTSVSDTSSQTTTTVQYSSSTTSDDDLTATTELMTICPQETMTVDISVDESDILSVSVGQEAILTIDSIGEDTYTGTVTAIDSEGSSSSGVTTYPVSVSLEKTDQMRAGMSVSAAIQIEGVENALLLPSDAVTTTREQTYVYTSVDEETGELSGLTEVTTGISGNGYIEITDGLQEGDTVYYEAEESSGFSMDMFGGGTQDMGDFDAGDLPDSGSMPDMGGGSMPGGGGSMPGGGQ